MSPAYNIIAGNWPVNMFTKCLFTSQTVHCPWVINRDSQLNLLWRESLSTFTGNQEFVPEHLWPEYLCSNLCSEVWRAEKPCKCIPNKDKFVCGYNETFPPGNEDSGWLVPLDTCEQGIDGIGQARKMRETLVGVEGEQLWIFQRQRDWGWRTQLERNREHNSHKHTKYCI